jgi:murein hydrolase activator
VELRSQVEYRLVGGGRMIFLILALQLAHAQAPAGTSPAADENIADQIQETRAIISEAEKRQREALSHLFVINKKIKDISKRRAKLNETLLQREGTVRELAQEVQELEELSEQRKGMLNQRLRRLYQERRQDSFQWLFSANSPVEFERNQRFLRKIIDSDHHQLKAYLAHLKELKAKREQLRGRVLELARTQKEIEVQERELGGQLKQKSRLVAELRQSKNSKIGELKELRGSGGDGALEYAFFERKGNLRAPVEAPLIREYGTYVDPKHKFKLMHKGLFYRAAKGASVHAVAAGTVALASQLPGYGKAVIVDHGDNYYSVYGFNQQLKVREGSQVREGEILALSGGASPLFGPGLYFEIRHFTDAIDPRNWIKDSVIKTANH